jgi:nucleoside-diphosphate-sugar epimerase
LITGGAGFIGIDLVKEFLRRGEEIVIFDRAIPQDLFAGEKRVSKIKGDITNWPEVMNVVQQNKVDTIFHLAAILSAVAEGNPWTAININALGTYHVLEAARLFQTQKVVFTSSLGAYGVTQDVIVTEDTVQRPSIIYGVTKVFSELLGLYYHKKFGLDFRGIRFRNSKGPGVKTLGFGQYNPWLIEAAIKGEPFDVWVPEDTVIPLMYIKDVIRSLVMLGDAPESSLKMRVYNLGQIMPPPTAKDLVEMVKRHFPEARINYKPDPNAVKVIKTIPRIIKGDQAEKEWGWKMRFSLEASVADFINEFGKCAPKRTILDSEMQEIPLFVSDWTT